MEVDEVDQREASPSNRQQPEVIMNTMNDNDQSCQSKPLPDLVLELIFDHLPLTDLLRIDQVIMSKVVAASQQFVC